MTAGVAKLRRILSEGSCACKTTSLPFSPKAVVSRSHSASRKVPEAKDDTRASKTLLQRRRPKEVQEVVPDGPAQAAQSTSSQQEDRTPSASSSAVVPEGAPRVIYACDVEGHWEYFCNFIELCGERLRFAEHGDQRRARSAPELVLADDWHFVFGGDSCDKGPGTIRFVQCMVRFKKKYPDRVHLILGNRDANKMRWTAELDQTEIDRVRDVPAAFWLPEKTRITPWQFLRRTAMEGEGVPEEELTAEMLQRHNTKANKLRYMLRHDMGSDGDFDFRRAEVAHMRQVDVREVSDADVVESYEASVLPGGWMHEYIQLAELAVFLGDTLYVHGQVIGNQFRQSLGDATWCVRVVPSGTGSISGFEEVDGLREWVAKLNAWCREQVQDWVCRPKWEKPPATSERASWHGRGGSALLEYGTPATPVPSVVYCRWLDEDCMPKPYPPDLVDYLISQDVRRVVVGHTPHGNCPTVIPHDGLTVLMGDTSYSEMKSDLAFAGDNRGDAVSLILLENDTAHVLGRTQKKQIIDYKVGPRPASSLVGRVQGCGIHERDRHFVKAKFYEEGHLRNSSYLMCRVDGFKNDYTVLGKDEVLRTLSGQPLLRNSSSHSLITSHGDLFGHDFGEGEGRMFGYLWRQLDRDGDGNVSNQELLAALTERHVREALSLAFADSSLEAIAEELNRQHHAPASLKEETPVSRGITSGLGSRPDSLRQGGGTTFSTASATGDQGDNVSTASTVASSSSGPKVTVPPASRRVEQRLLAGPFFSSPAAAGAPVPAPAPQLPRQALGSPPGRPEDPPPQPPPAPSPAGSWCGALAKRGRELRGRPGWFGFFARKKKEPTDACR